MTMFFRRGALLRAAAGAALSGVVTAVLAAHITSAHPVEASTVSMAAPPATAAQATRLDTGIDESPDHSPRLYSVTVAATPPPATPPPAPAAQAASPLSNAASTPAPYHRPAPTHTPAPAPAAATAPPAGAVSGIVSLVNQDRAAAGLPALRWSAALGRAAQTHAGQNAANDQMSHDGVVQDVDAQGVSWQSLGECLGWNTGSPDPGYINSMWMQSSEHHAIIVGNFTTLGVGWAESASGKWYVSLIVIR